MAYSPMRHAKRVIVFVVGVTILLLGLAMLVLPGPGILVLTAGLAILGTEFLWARRLLHKVKENTVEAGRRWWNGNSKG